MTLRQSIVALVVLLALLALAGPPAHAVDPPPALRDWQDWVLRDLPQQRCPLLRPHRLPQPGAWACVWPGRIDIDVTGSSIAFALDVRIYVEDWLPLPGDESLWPAALRVDGRERPLVLREGRPAVRLPAGRHRVEGRIDAPRRPAQLPLPDGYAWIRLRVDDVPRDQALYSAQGLWLGVPDTPAPAQVPDALRIDVFRRLDDGVPMMLETRIRLVVSGAVRELDLGGVLPPGVRPLALESPLDAAWIPDRGLVLLLRPGSHQVVLRARASEALPQLVAPVLPEPWPQSELWSYASDPQLRLLDVQAARPVDPRQEEIPGEWHALPAWRLEGGEALGLSERSRGRSEAGALSLRLNRELWLDFDGRGLHSRDRIQGRVGPRGRLEQPAGWTLLRAELDGQPQPLSRSPDGGIGIELRGDRINLLASSRLAAGEVMSVTGWQAPFDRVDLELHLPPGRVLLAAPGADRAGDTWLARWTLLDLFLVLLTAMLAGRLLGPGFAAMVMVLLVIAYPEAPGLLYALLLALAMQLLREAIGAAGWFARLVGWMRNALLLVLVLVALPFVAGQLRLALYPQLERPQVSVAGAGQAMRGVLAQSREFAVDALDAGAGLADQDQQRASRMSALAPETMMAEPVTATTPPIERAIASPLALAGPGQPEWAWTLYRLSWSGPVLPEQAVRLLILPRWATALLRVGSVLLLALLLLAWARRLRHDAAIGPGEAVSATPAALVLAVCLGAVALTPPTAQAQVTPDPGQLQALRDWLLRPPPCVPVCTDLARIGIEADEQRLNIVLDVHVESAAAFALPAVEPRLRIEAIRVDGQPAESLLREGAHPLLWLGPGIRRVNIDLASGRSERINLAFQQRPRSLRFSLADGWSAVGLDGDGRLTGTTLELRRNLAAEPENDPVQVQPSLRQRGLSAAAFFHVERELLMGSEWVLRSQVQRVAPVGQPVRMQLALWPGERPLDLPAGVGVEGEQLVLDFAAGRDRLEWQSRLETATLLDLMAGDGDLMAEQWRIAPSGLWRVESSGLPLSALLDPGGVQVFRPMSGEQLSLRVEAVEALPGAWLAIDAVAVDIQLGRRAADYRLEATLRAAQAGQHPIRLPTGIELRGVEGMNLSAGPDGSLLLPVAPGIQRVVLLWRDPSGAGSRWTSRLPDLGESAANIGIDLRLSDERWVLATRGPALGPAVLYWSELAVMLLIAFALARSGRTPLKLHHWLLLGLGFSTLSWAALSFIVIWLLAVDLRSRAQLSGGQLNLVQMGLGLMTLIALLVLVSIIPLGLLGSPDMQLTGNGSSAFQLRWFADRSGDGQLPEVGLWSLPIWAYRLAILAWAIWLAAALLGWLRWTWKAMGHGGYWERRPSQQGSDAAGADRGPESS